MKACFTLILMVGFSFSVFGQGLWVKTYEIESVRYLEQTQDEGFFLYSESSRMKVNSQGDSLFTEPFKFPKNEFKYDFENGVLTKQDTFGNIIWVRGFSANYYNASYRVTRSGIAYIFYIQPDLLNGYAIMYVYDSDGNSILQKTVNNTGGDRISFFEEKLDGSAIISELTFSGPRPQGTATTSGVSTLYNAKGEIECEIEEFNSVYDPSVRSINMAITPNGVCRKITLHNPGLNNTNPYAREGYLSSCIPSNEIIGGVPFQMIGLKDGGYAYLGKENNQISLTRVYCGHESRKTFKGIVYEDTNQNCIVDSEDKPLPNINFEVDGNSFSSLSDGSFTTFLRFSPSLESEIKLDSLDSLNWIGCKPSIIVDYTSNELTNYNILLADKNNLIEQILVSAGTSEDSICDNSNVNIDYCNDGLSNVKEGILKIVLPQFTEFYDSKPSPDSLIGNEIFYSFENLEVNDCAQIKMEIHTDCNEVSSDDLSLVIINLINGVSDTTNVNLITSFSNSSLEITPNVEFVNPKLNFDLELKNTPVIYKITFRNNTNDSIKVKELELFSSENLDMENLKIISSSHNFTKNIGTLDVLTTDFVLPPSHHNYSKSKGYVKVEIPLKPFNRLNQVVTLRTSSPELGNSLQNWLRIGRNIIKETYCDTTVCSSNFDNVRDVQYSSIGDFEVDLKYVNKSIFPSNLDTLNLEGCQGDTLIINGIEIINNRKYEIIESDVNGCDSGLIIIPIFHSVFSNAQQVSVSAGAIFNGILINQDTVIREVFVDRNGCDSTYFYEVSIISKTENPKSALNRINIYPNPTKNQLTLDFESIQKGNFNFKITNIYGRQEIIKSEEIQLGGNNLNFNTEKLQSGVFFISIENPRTGATRFVSKFIKI